MTQTLDALLSELEERAKAEPEGSVWHLPDLYYELINGSYRKVPANAQAFMQACLPQVVLKLVAVIRRMREALNTYADPYYYPLSPANAQTILSDVEAIVRGTPEGVEGET
jgi:hypothetical protein